MSVRNIVFPTFKVPPGTPKWLENDTLEMEQHIRLLHPKGSDGYIVLASKWGGHYKQALHRAREMPTIADLARAQFVSMNRFTTSRMGDALCSVGHVWLEFDPYAEDAQGNALPHRETPLEDLMALLSEAIHAAGLPAPSYWTKSGRGLHAVWECEALPGRAAPKLRRILRELYGPTLNEDGSVPARFRTDPDRDAQEARLAPMWRLFRDAGLDTQTQDSSRVLRIWGSYNQASGTLCERLWPIWIHDIRRCRVDDLADAVLPLTGVAYRQRMAEKAAEPAEPKAAEPPKRPRSATAYAGKAGVWERKLSDLLRLREHRGRIAKGQRHAWVFLTANAYAQARGGDPATWAAMLAPLAGLTTADALDCLQSLGRRQRRHEAGETVEHKKTAWNPLFHYSGSKMADLLGVTELEADMAGLALIRPGKGQAIPDIERKRAKRVRDGAVPRADRADAKLQAGRQGLALRVEGKSYDEAIAAIRAGTGRGRSWAVEAMKLVATTKVEAVAEPVAPAPEPRKSDLEQVRFPGRYIGGSAPARPPASPIRLVVASSRPAATAPGPVPEPYASPRVTRVSSISTMIETAPGVGYLVVDDPLDKLMGRYTLALGGDFTALPAHLEALVPQRSRKAARADRHAARRISGPTRPTPSQPSLTADEYRRITKGY